MPRGKGPGGGEGEKGLFAPRGYGIVHDATMSYLDLSVSRGM